MINHKIFYRRSTKKGCTITQSSDDQHNIGTFSIGEVGSALEACYQNWECFGSQLREREKRRRTPLQPSSITFFTICIYIFYH